MVEDKILDILNKIIILSEEKIKNYDYNNWQDVIIIEKIKEIQGIMQKYLDKYLSYLELKNDPDLLEESIAEIDSIKLEVRDFILDRILTNLEKSPSFFMEIKTGTGGLDAQDWSSMLLRMYIRYFEKNNIEFDLTDKNEKIKNITLKVKLPMFYMLGEIGIHRLVRISPFNEQKKRQTSFSSVYIYGSQEVNEIVIDKNDIVIDTFKSSGAGGQHVNKTESAVRITHIPTGFVATCQNERSQQKNRETAMQLLKSKILTQKKEELLKSNILQDKQIVSWGQQFRSYVLNPYQAIKDNRINMEVNNIAVEKFLNGNIDEFLEQFLWKKVFDEYVQILNF